MIQFKISKRWSRSEDMQALAERVADIVRGHHGFKPYLKDDKSVKIYHLDAGNDWWLEIKPDNIAELRYRYDCPGNITLEEWAALKTVIEWAIGYRQEVSEAAMMAG